MPDQLVTLYDTVWSNLQFVKKSLDQYPLQDNEAQDAAEQRLLEKLVSGPVPGRPVLLIGNERNLYDEGLIARAFLRLQQTIAGDSQPQPPQSPHSEQQSDCEPRDGDGEGRSDSTRPILVVTEVRPQQKMSKCFSTVVWQTRLAAGGFMTQKELLTFSCNSWQSFFAALPSDRRVILVFAHVENFAPPEAFAASSQASRGHMSALSATCDYTICVHTKPIVNTLRRCAGQKLRADAHRGAPLAERSGARAPAVPREPERLASAH